MRLPLSLSRLILCAVAIALLAACGSTPTATPVPVPTATTRPAAPTTAAGATATTSRVGSPTVASGTPANTSATPVAATPVAATPKLPVTIIDKTGKSVTVKDISRIVALTGDVAEIIFALGLGGQIVATDISATYPPAAVTLPKIGYNRTLAAEGILALKPTVIIGTETAGPPEVLEQLRGAGIPVVIIAAPSTLDAPAAKIRDTGAALGVPEAAGRVAAQTQGEIDAAKALAAKATTQPRVMFLNVRGTTVQQISGKGAPAESMIVAAGGIDAGAASGVVGYKPITPEALVAGQPDIYLLFQLGLDSVGGEAGLLKLPGLDQTPAGKNKRIIAYEDQYLLGLGPRTGQVLHDLVLALHPELK